MRPSRSDTLLSTSNIWDQQRHCCKEFLRVLASQGQRLAQGSTQAKLPDPHGSEWLQQGVFQHWKGHPCKAEDSRDTVLSVTTWLFNNMIWKLGTFT